MRTALPHPTMLILQLFVLGSLFCAQVLQGQEVKRTARTIGLALSGGGARGGAHIGVLKILEKEGIKVNYIAGTSIGAIIGGLYACGYSPDEIERLLLNHWPDVFSNQAVRTSDALTQYQKLRQLFRIDLKKFKPSLPMGVLTGQKAIELFGRFTLESMLEANYDFDRLPIKFRSVATILSTGEPYIFKKGRMSEAIYASFAQPMVFSPVRKDGLLLVDGGLAANLPAEIAKEMGADIVIAVDVTSPEPNSVDIVNLLNIAEQSISLRTRSTVQPNYKYADVIVKPHLDGFSFNDFKRLPEIINAGIEAAGHSIKEIREKTGEVTEKMPDKKQSAEIRIIDSILFEDVSLSRSQITPSSTLLRQVKSRPGDKIVAGSLAADIARLYATGMFDVVDYECRRVADGRYKLVFLLTASSWANLGISLRYDREYNLQGLAELAIRNLFETGSYGVISARSGGTTHLTGALRLIHPRLPMLYIEPQAQILTHERFEFNSSQGTTVWLDKRRTAQVMLGATIRKRFEMSAGYRFETERFMPKTVRNNHEASTNLSGLRLHLRRDTLDHQEFPRSGMDLEIAGSLKTRKLGADWSYSIIQGGIKRYFSPSEKTTLMIRTEGFKSGGTLPSFERAYLGGYSYSDTASHRFAGYERDEFSVPNMALAGVAYRRQLFRRPLGFIHKGYLTTEYNLAWMETPAADTAAFDRVVVHGGAIGIGFNTLIGPIRLSLGIGESGKPKIYISLGPSF